MTPPNDPQRHHPPTWFLQLPLTLASPGKRTVCTRAHLTGLPHSLLAAANAGFEPGIGHHGHSTRPVPRSVAATSGIRTDRSGHRPLGTPCPYRCNGDSLFAPPPANAYCRHHSFLCARWGHQSEPGNSRSPLADSTSITPATCDLCHNT